MDENNIAPNNPDVSSISNVSDKPNIRSYPKLTPIIKMSLLFALIISLIFGMNLMFPCTSFKTLKQMQDNRMSYQNVFGGESFGLKKFSSEDEFKDYLASVPTSVYGYTGFEMLRTTSVSPVAEDMIQNEGNTKFGLGAGPADVSRVSSTNVQVEGIDEPDIVKVDEKSLFTSLSVGWLYDLMPYDVMPMEKSVVNEEMEIYPVPDVPQRDEETKIISAFPPSDMKKVGGVDKIGNLLLSGDTLVIFSGDTIYGYDVSDRSNPKESWNIPYGDNTYYKDARLYGDNIYLITQTYLDISRPCPYTPLRYNVEGLSIACTDIYHPIIPVNSGSTYTIVKINAKTGSIDDTSSFLGESYTSVLYMSEDSLYLTYSYNEDYLSIFVRFIQEEGSDLFSSEVNSRLKRLASYDLSNSAKMVEMQQIIEKYMIGLSSDDQLKLENEMSNRMTSFTEKHIREFESTGIVKISLDKLDIDATGVVPGHPLNQFSLDEYEGNLRIATNSGTNMIWGTSGDINDVYILNSNLKEIGSVKNLGKDEMIYSTRFIEDKGYVVTFKQTDPFYVLDLSNPNDPKMKGELKIPGFSSYLHPINKDLILGVGIEDSNVKLSLFDVSDAENPAELDKYILNEYWTEVSDSHHAFLMDSKHGVFFMPGGSGGYIFSYEDNKLRLVKAVSSYGVKRAVYVNDFMYIVGERGVVVLDENSWEEVKDFKFD